MSKELTPLEIVKRWKAQISWKKDWGWEKELNIIENALKAVEIVKKKRVDLAELLKVFPHLEKYNKDRFKPNQLTEEEQDLIYDVFSEHISIDAWVGAMAELDDPDMPKGRN